MILAIDGTKRIRDGGMVVDMRNQLEAIMSFWHKRYGTDPAGPTAVCYGSNTGTTAVVSWWAEVHGYQRFHVEECYNILGQKRIDTLLQLARSLHADSPWSGKSCRPPLVVAFPWRDTNRSRRMIEQAKGQGLDVDGFDFGGQNAGSRSAPGIISQVRGLE